MSLYSDLKIKYERQFGAGGAKGSPLSDAAILMQTDDGAWYYALSPERVNVIESFPWERNMEVLQLGACYGAFTPLSERVKAFDILETDETSRAFLSVRHPASKACYKDKPLKKYDAVIFPLSEGAAALKNAGLPAGTPEEAVQTVLSFLKETGSLLFFADNADAVKFLFGAKHEAGGICITKSGLDGISAAVPLKYKKAYYPLPSAAFAKSIYSETSMPGEGAFRAVSEDTALERYVVCDEEAIYGKLSAHNAFPAFAPSFLMVYTGDEGVYSSLPSFVKYNRMRDEKYAIKTEVFESLPTGFYAPCGVNEGHAPAGTETARPEKSEGTLPASGKKAVKKALSKEANAHIEGFLKRAAILKKEACGRFNVLDASFGEDSCGLKYAVFDFLNGEDLGKALSKKIKDGLAPADDIKKAMETALGAGDAPCRNMDALFENFIISPEGGLTLIDYEWVADEAPEKGFLKYRMLRYWYEAYKGKLTAYKNLEDFLYASGFPEEEQAKYAAQELAFQTKVRGGMKELEEHYAKPQSYVSDIQKELREKEAQAHELSAERQALSKERETERLSQNHIRNIEFINKTYKERIDALEKERDYLLRHQSLISRAGRKCIAALDSFAPAGSKKRAAIHLAKDFVRRPLFMLKRLFSGEGRKLISGQLDLGEAFREGGILNLPSCAKPLVTIVIPVYNEVSYTYSCIKSIVENTDAAETPYEVILADDVSTDATVRIADYIKGLKVSRNKVNTGFLKNCNQAAAKALGDYIFFLNNDTKVHGNWLSSLVKLMEGDPSIGMAGSKLVYPDGRLQEAGGIIWSDASGWNYGRMDDPGKPEYNYVKDVDYISGAAIMIRRSLWEDIGGFDELYAPAYCEDSDLAFAVRKAGKRVVYQPASVVTHFEGVSNGTDVNGTGLKRYQAENQVKFAKKWAGELKDQQENTGNPDPFTARDRTSGKKCLVVIDHYVPTWDKDAGSRTTFQYLRMFVKKGYNVKFIGDNFLKEEPYAGVLMQMGIEVLYGGWYRDNIYAWLKENSAHIDICYLNRPHIAVKYIEFLKKETGIKCIFYGHDLHCLRLKREYALSGDINALKEAEYWRSVEFSVMDKADISYYPSEAEISFIHKERPDINVKAITAYMWEEEKAAVPASFDERNGVLFVGGFKHPPNADAVKWFAASVWPKVRKALPEARFLIAGSGADESIKALSTKENGIEVLGFVSDERLEELYRTTRVVAVPLRYGAGVKGKVVEALYNNAAVITTETGAEGIPDAEKVMVVVSKAAADKGPGHDSLEERFAEGLIELYSDTGKCASLSRSCAPFIRGHYSMDAAWGAIKEDFS